MARTPNSSSVQYAPDNPPNDPAQFQRYVYTEFLKLQAAIAALSAGHLDYTHVEPSKPRGVNIRAADGVDWDPGSGRGIYAFNGTGWVLVVAL